MKILLIAEHDNHDLKAATYYVVTAALQLSQEIDLLIMGHHCDNVVKQSEKIAGIKRILVADASEYTHQQPENCAPLIADLSADYGYILTASDTYGKNILPRVAALLDMNMVSDIIKIVAKDTFVRPIYAGNALVTIKSTEKIKLLSIRTTAFARAVIDNQQLVTIDKITKIIPNTLAKLVQKELTVSERPELTSARIVISGGRGLKSADNFKLLEKLADQLGAALGASRAAVDAGFVPNDYQVGQTGKIIAPDLYIAVGISGAIQHLAGMKDSKVIVAINNDPEAPIFQVADYGLVGDLFKIIPELAAALAKH